MGLRVRIFVLVTVLCVVANVWILNRSVPDISAGEQGAYFVPSDCGDHHRKLYAPHHSYSHIFTQPHNSLSSRRRRSRRFRTCLFLPIPRPSPNLHPFPPFTRLF